MNRKLQTFTVIAMLSFCMHGHAQIKVSELDNSAPAQGMQLHFDPKLAIVLKKHTTGNIGVIRSGKGFRVQIYSGNERAKATSLKIDFMRRFPDVPTYMTYVQPQFRVKVGNYRTRAEAYKMYEQLSGLYDPCMIVPDFIVINSTKND